MTLKIRWKILLSMAPVILIIVLLVMVLVIRIIEQSVEENIHQNLVRANLVFESVQEDQSKSLVAKGRLVTQISYVKALILGENVDAIRQFSKDSLKKLESAIMIVTDHKGTILARTDKEDAGESLADFGPVMTAISGEEGKGFLNEPDHLYQVFSFPLRAGPSTLGTISIGYEIDDAYTQRLKHLTGNEISVISGGKIVASVWDGETRRALEKFLQGRTGFSQGKNLAGMTDQTFDIHLGSKSFRSMLAPFEDAGGSGSLFYLIQASQEEAMSMLSRIRQTILALGVLAVLITIAVSYGFARYISTPVTELVAATDTLAEGNLSQSVRVRGRDELGHLAESFNRMTQGLREFMIDVKQAEVQINTSAAEISAGTSQHAAGAAQQSSAVAEVSTTVEELSQTASLIADNTQNLRKTAEKSLQGMVEIKSKVDQVAKIL